MTGTNPSSISLIYPGGVWRALLLLPWFAKPSSAALRTNLFQISSSTTAPLGISVMGIHHALPGG